jgi:spore coat polysaccharide biosynthesis protein SpsF
MKNIVAIIQARMGSKRLPGKILKDLCGKSVICHIYDRLKRASKINKIVVATTGKKKDEILVQHLKANKIDYFRGSENDVLDRFYQTSKLFKAKYIIRITADCPLIDSFWIDRAVNKILENPTIDYLGLPTGAGVFYEKVNKLPDGLDAEVFKYEALEKAWIEAESHQDRGEAVTSYIWKNKDKFKTFSIYPEVDYGNLRWTLDTPEDFQFIKLIYKALYEKNKNFTFNDILDYLKENPNINNLNQRSKNQVKYNSYYKD